MTKIRSRVLMITAGLYSLLALSVVFSAPAKAQTSEIEFESCFIDGLSRQVECATFEVPENWDDPAGAKISLSMAIVPARGEDPNPDPFILFAGGPGQAAMDYAGFVPSFLRRVNQTRDIILLDQRGTGESTALDCDFPPGTAAKIPDEAFSDSIRYCLETYENDIRYFTSFDIIKDLEYLRTALGVDQFNIWGGSYGTRLGLLYMKLHPESIRSAVLDGVAAPNARLFVEAPGAAEAAWQKLIAACNSDAACAKAYPNLDTDFNTFLDDLALNPVTWEVKDLWTGKFVEVLIDRDWLAESIRSSLYQPSRTILLPYALERARAGDYQSLIALSQDANIWAGQTMSIGSTLAILCSEEVPRNPVEQVRAAGEGSFHTDYYYRFWALACQDVPTRDVLDGYEDPITVEVPTLILSGGLDPVTPPSMGEAAERHLPNVWHWVTDNAGHNVTPVGCAPRLIAEFVNAASGDGIDFECINDPVRPPFLLNPLTYGLSADSEGE